MRKIVDAAGRRHGIRRAVQVVVVEQAVGWVQVPQVVDGVRDVARHAVVGQVEELKVGAVGGQRGRKLAADWQPTRQAQRRAGDVDGTRYTTQ